MPLYDFRCTNNHLFERLVRLADFEEMVFCPCAAVANRVISAPMFSVDNVGYSCPVTDQWIGSKREHEENLKRTDSRVLETGEKESNGRAGAAREAEFEKSIEATVEREWDGLSSEKREKIGAELTGGVDLQYERSTK